jgi:hypothetical protein
MCPCLEPWIPDWLNFTQIVEREVAKENQMLYRGEREWLLGMPKLQAYRCKG